MSNITLRDLSILLIGVALGSLTLFLFDLPKYAKIRSEELRMEAFGQCLESKIIGLADKKELMLLDVINCLKK